MKFLIDNFGVSNLFGRENYEYYARITGRILKVEEDWIFSFRYPPDYLVSRKSCCPCGRQVQSHQRKFSNILVWFLCRTCVPPGGENLVTVRVRAMGS